MRWQLAFVFASSLVSVLLIVVHTFSYIEMTETKRASCDALLIALGGTSQVALAGVKQIEFPRGVPEYLQDSLNQHVQEARAENARLLEAVRKVDEAMDTLRRSDLCKT